MRLGKPWQYPEAAPAGPLLDHPVPVVEQARIAAKLVDEKSPDHRRIRIGQDRARPHDLGDDTAPVDIAGKDHRHASRHRKPHIRDVARPQVHLRGTSRPFDDHKVCLRRKQMKTLDNLGHQVRLAT